MVITALCFATASPSWSQSPGSEDSSPATESGKSAGVKRVLTPAEKAEKAQRRVCKVQICSILSTKDPQGADIDCPIVKTWREEDIENMLSGGKLDWPWGKARCTTQLKLKRSTLAAAASPRSSTAKLDTHRIACSLDLKSDGETYDITVEITPEVTFKDGKATSGRLNWGSIDAPMLAYSVIWPSAKLDNSLNALEGPLVEMVNEFMGKKCREVKDQLPLRASVTTPAN
ncbi:MAG: hypothetical protein MPJ78_03130 [Hyphomicrobiaceae bacterium]|nr:hypothetical protein [Hyphomicrobiaceae bacterium]